MAALMRLIGPSVARYFDPGPDDLIDTFFDETPMPVTIEVFPFAPATRITDQKLSINGASREFTGVSGQNPVTLQFHLGGDAGETAGGINTVNVTVTDDAGGTTHFSLRYFRRASTPETQQLSTHPPTTLGKPPAGAGSMTLPTAVPAFADAPLSAK